MMAASPLTPSSTAVIELGRHRVKAGWAGEVAPRVTFTPQTLSGYSIVKEAARALRVQQGGHRSVNVLLVASDDVVFRQHQNGKGTDLLLMEAARDCFDHVGAGRVVVLPSSVGSLVASATGTGVCLDLGHSSARAVMVTEGRALATSLVTSRRAGGLSVTDVVRDRLRAGKGGGEPFVLRATTDDCESFKRTACGACLEAPRRGAAELPAAFVAPDGAVIDLWGGSDRHVGSDALERCWFDEPQRDPPGASETAPDGGSLVSLWLSALHHGVDTLSARSIGGSSAAILGTTLPLPPTIVAGGASTTRGLLARLRVEASSPHRDARFHPDFASTQSSDQWSVASRSAVITIGLPPSSAAWTGGSVLADAAAFPFIGVSREEFDDSGWAAFAASL